MHEAKNLSLISQFYSIYFNFFYESPVDCSNFDE